MEEAESSVEAIIHAEKVGPEERVHFNRAMTVEEIIKTLRNGALGNKLLLSQIGHPDDNVVVEYRPNT